MAAQSPSATAAPEDRSTGDGAGDRAREAAGQVQEKAGEVAGQAQETAQQALGQARSRAREQIDQRSTQAAEQIGQQASDLRSVGQALREQGKDGPAQIADRISEQAEKVSGYLHGRDADQLLHDAEDYARRQPWAAVGAGVALGFAASRFLKASSRRRYDARSPGAGAQASLPAPSGGGMATPGVPASPGAAPPTLADGEATGAPAPAPTRAPTPPPPNGGPAAAGEAA